MTIHRRLHVVCVAGVAVMLAACSGQPESLTAPSALNSAATASAPGSPTPAAHTERVTIATRAVFPPLQSGAPPGSRPCVMDSTGLRYKAGGQ